MPKFAKFGAVFVITCLSLSACVFPLHHPESSVPSPEREAAPSEPRPESGREPEPEEEPAPPPTQVTLAAVGDIMLHSTQIDAARQQDGTYDFQDVFADIAPYFDAADLVYGNLETTFSGEKPYTGYPLFNAPDELADALADVGFDLIQTANNHTLDTHAEGAVRTHNVLKEKGMAPVGTAATPADRKPVLLEKNGITLAFLAYTYGTNGIPIPEDQPHLVNVIDEDVMARDIQDARDDGAEFVIVGVHFGNEYEREPTDEQRKLVTRLFEMGADIVLGGHPHVLQPMEQMEVDGDDKFVIYSLGNFVSNQFFNPYVNKGTILYLDIEKDFEKETVTLKDISFLPTVVHRYEQNGTGYAIIPIEEAHIEQETLARRYPGLSFQMVKEAWEQTRSHMGRYESFPIFKLDKRDPH